MYYYYYYYKSRWGRRSQFLGQKLQISNRLLTESCKFLIEKIWVLKISTLLLNFLKMGVFRPKFCIFGWKLLTRFLDSPKFRGHLSPPPPQRHWSWLSRNHRVSIMHLLSYIMYKSIFQLSLKENSHLMNSMQHAFKTVISNKLMSKNIVTALKSSLRIHTNMLLT